jgi:hypothetical protein
MPPVPALVNLLHVSDACYLYTRFPFGSRRLLSLSSLTSTVFSDSAFPINAFLGWLSGTERGLAFVLPFEIADRDRLSEFTAIL